MSLSSAQAARPPSEPTAVFGAVPVCCAMAGVHSQHASATAMAGANLAFEGRSRWVVILASGLHRHQMRKATAGAIAAGVKRVVLIGTVYPYGRPQSTPLREDHPREPHTSKGRMRKAQEDVLMEMAAAAGIQATVLRLPDFYGP